METVFQDIRYTWRQLRKRQMSGICSSDSLSMAAAKLLIVLVAMIAASLPARRAAKINPIAALRYE